MSIDKGQLPYIFIPTDSTQRKISSFAIFRRRTDMISIIAKRAARSRAECEKLCFICSNTAMEE